MSKSISHQREEVVRVRVPFTIRKRGGRKLIVMPAGVEAAPAPRHIDNAIVRRSPERSDCASYWTLVSTEPSTSSPLRRRLIPRTSAVRCA
jgi:hypothetical protein